MRDANPQMRNGCPTASECHSASAERVSNGVGMPIRKCGTHVRRRRNAIPEVRNGCLEARECHSGSPERHNPRAQKWFLIAISEVFHELHALVHRRVGHVRVAQAAPELVEALEIHLVHPFLHAGEDLGDKLRTMRI